MTTWEVYALSDPRTKRMMYVGVTSKGAASRAASHVESPGSEPMRKWIDSMSAKGVGPSVSVLESVECETPADAYAVEKRWIKKMTTDGHELLNIVHAKAHMLDGYRAAMAKQAVQRATRIVAQCERKLEEANRRLVAAIERDKNGGVGTY